MFISTKEFGKIGDQSITLYTLSNQRGMSVSIMNYGATITRLEVADKDQQMIQVACGFDTLEDYFSEDYKSNAPYFGCTVGRYASRIKDGIFIIDGTKYSTSCNDGPNHLHGGLRGFDKKIWDAEVQADESGDMLVMSLHSSHLEEGYPGNVDVQVVFRLTEDNKIEISYQGISDQETPLSLTNHTYFNLSGFQETIESHMARIEASTFLRPDDTNVPQGDISSVTDSAADLQRMTRLEDSLAKLETGFEHYYLFDNFNGEVNKVASFIYPQKGLQLDVHTTEPGALFYTGYFTSDELGRNSKEQYGKYKGLCFETSRYPNGPNIEGSPLSTTAPGTPYRSKTVFEFINAPNGGLEL